MSETKDKAVTERQILHFFWKATLNYRHGLLGGLLVPLSYLALNTFLPFYTGKLLAALGTDPHHPTKFLPYLFVVGAVGVVANRFGTVWIFRLQAKVIADLQTLCLNNLLQQSTSFHNNRVAGKLVSDAIDFPSAYSMLSNAFLINMIPLGTGLIIGILLVSVKSWLLGLVLLGMASVTIGVALWQSKTRRPLRARRLTASKAVTSHLADTIVNNQTVKTFAQEEHELDHHRKLNDTLLDIRIEDWSSGARAGNNRIAGLLVFQLLFAVVIIHVVQRDPSLLAIGIFAFSYSITLSNNLFSINNVIRQVEDAFLQASPMVEVLLSTPAIQDKPGSTELYATKGAIEFNDVTFSYMDSDSQESVFNNLNLSIAAGEKIGLVGTSGGGKSTLTRLLLRFNDIQSGSIAIDGQNIASVTQDSLRRTIAYVPQEPLMFHRSVRENIAYGNLDTTERGVKKAAQQAYADDFIEQLPGGYDTLVGERGVKLSGGQRQRVAIARALLKDAPVLVLDEATSALDSGSEALIQQALRGLMESRTAIVVAHRLSTIQNMDRIIVLEDGKITEQGTHTQLLKKKGAYAKLWAHQSGGFIEE